MRTHRPRLAAAFVAIGILAVAVLSIRVPPPYPTTAPNIRVRWAPSVGDVERADRESAFRLRRDRPSTDRTWSYVLLDTSQGNVRALVTDPAVEDTDGLDRVRFRVATPPVTIAERLTGEFPAVERIAGPGFSGWMSSTNAWPGALAAAWLVALSRPSIRAVVFRGLPVLSPIGLGLFRIAFGVALLLILPAAAALPEAPLPRELHRAAGWFADWEWVHWLAMHPDASALTLTVAMAALALFAAGVIPRVMYLVALVCITARVFVLLQHNSEHDWGLPLVAMWGLSLAPWDAGLTLVPFRRQRGGETSCGYAVWLPGAVLGLGLLAAAYAKLATSGIDWVLGGAVKYHFIEDFGQAPTAWGLWIAARPAWAVAASGAAVVVESVFVLHVLFRQPRVRAVYAVAALSLPAGFYLFQGVFWPQWWVLLLALLPWESFAAAVPRPGVREKGSQPALSLPQVALVGALVCVQVFASARRVEVEPFVSDYGMYAWTWPSTEAFDQHIARKYRAYRYVAGDAGGVVDVTDRVRSLPGASAALTEAVDRLRDGGEPPESERAALRAIAAMYQSSSGDLSGRLTVLVDEQAFDWTRGRFYQKVEGGRIGVLDLSTGMLISADGITAVP